MSAGNYVQKLIQYGETLCKVGKADGSAWGQALSDLTGSDEKAVNAYFTAATEALETQGFKATSPERRALRNHKSLMVGTLRRGETLKTGLKKGDVQEANAKARKAKAIANGTASPGESRKPISKAEPAELFAAFRAKVEMLAIPDRVAVLRAAGTEIAAMLKACKAQAN
jgi:hypothetical protein